MGAAAAAGAGLGQWLVNAAPVFPEEIAHTDDAASLIDAQGRSRNGLSPQPLSDGTLGMPVLHPQPDWEIRHISLYDGNLDPMVSLAIGSRIFTIGDVLADAGFGLATGEGDVGTVDITQEQSDQSDETSNQNTHSGTGDGSWQQALEAAVSACDNVGFFSRPGCIDRAQKQYCGPNNAWGKHRLCPSNDPNHTYGA